MEEQNNNPAWVAFRRLRNTFFNSVNQLCTNAAWEELIQQAFAYPLDTANALLLLETQLDYGDSCLAKKFSAELIKIAIVGSITNIVLARRVLSKMNNMPWEVPPATTIDRIISQHTATEDEEWLYRRGIELANVLNLASLKRHLITQCKNSGNEDLLDLAEDW